MKSLLRQRHRAPDPDQPLIRLRLGGQPWFDLTHEFRREQNRLMIKRKLDAFVCGLASGVLLVLLMSLAIYFITR